MRVTDQAASNRVSFENMQSILLSKMQSLIRKDLFDRDRTFKSAILRLIGRVSSGGRLADGGLCVCLWISDCRD